MKELVIIAGGKGTRLSSIREDIPKSMFPLAGKPVIAHQLEWARKMGIKKVQLILGHLPKPIIMYVRDGSDWGLNLSYFIEPEPLGTVGGVKRLESKLGPEFLVLYGDVIVDLDLKRLTSFHHKAKATATLVVHPNDHPHDSDLLELDSNGRIKTFYSKPHGEGWHPNLVNAGLYVFKKELLNYIPEGKKLDFGRDVFPGLITKADLYGYQTSEYLKDMGTPVRASQVNDDLMAGIPHRSNLLRPQKAIFFDRDGVINKDTNLISNPDQFEMYEEAPGALRKINKSDYLSILVTNQSVVARNLCTEDELRIIHSKMETLLGQEGAYLDAIYYCPHHPDKGYPEENKDYKIDCECRKPKPGMLLKAAKKYNIDLKESFMIGDQGRDIEAGIAAGVTTIGVRTGKALTGSKFLPDYLFQDVDEAVSFILEDPYQETFTRIKDQVANSKEKIFLIAIGGQSRSGKSILSNYLRLGLNRRDIKTKIWSLDHYILPREKRHDAQVMPERFQAELIERDLEEFMNGNRVETPKYSPGNQVDWPTEKYRKKDARVWIIEGVLALGLGFIKQHANLKLFFEN